MHAETRERADETVDRDLANGGATSGSRASQEPERETVGRPGRPVRALAFAGGAFDSALQLGVTHALLVSRARAPDVVVGISAGAVNAVALAEVLQAGESAGGAGPTSARVLAVKVARFRELFEEYQNAPGELVNQLLPDSFQIDAERPLEPLELPIHHLAERGERERSLQARTGLINLYNQLLRVRLPIGSLTRAVRRWLGWMATAEKRPGIKLVARVGELVRAWYLIGANLARLAPIVPALALVALDDDPRPARGASAGRIIFSSEPLRKLLRTALALFFVVYLASLWTFITALPVFLVVWVEPSVTSMIGALGVEASPVGVCLGLLGAAGLLVLALVAAFLGRDMAQEGLRIALSIALLLLCWLVPIALVTMASHWLIAGSLPSSPEQWKETASRIWAALGLLTVPFALFVMAHFRDVVLKVLRKNSVDAALLDPHPLREILVRAFDPAYYGKPSIDDVVRRALERRRKPSEAPREEKTIGSYAAATPPIHVGVVAADVASGALEVLPRSVPVVDGLLAATAVAPIFPPRPIRREHFEREEASYGLERREPSAGCRLFVDGYPIANEPVRSTISYLRERVDREASALHLYSVSPLPITTSELPPPATQEGEYKELVDVVARALELRRFRYARLERGLTRLLSRVMPEKGGIAHDVLRDGRRVPYLRAEVVPIEPERPLDVNARLLHAKTEEERRRFVAETVADGCRLSLETMIQPAIAESPKEEPRRAGSSESVTCRAALAAHLERHGCAASGPDLPGSSGDHGPGIVEVCKHCALVRKSDVEPEGPVSLRRRSSETPRPPEWPPVGSSRRGEPGQGGRRGESTHERETARSLSRYREIRAAAPLERRWPREREHLEDREQAPTVSFLFSGGVFRGVFQLGVLNALNEVNLQPDIVAGASIGSITGAMAASVFCRSECSERRLGIARLAATYLAIDRLVLTDRFADFVREFTLRAAQTRFSLRDLDRVFRQYDRPGVTTFGKELRTVLAGLERLLYVSPFELKSLVEAIRMQDYGRSVELVQSYFQELLHRYRVSNQILGAEPLELLIEEHVLSELAPSEGNGGGEPMLDAFFEKAGIYLLATATNLTRGRLEILGEQQLGDEERRATLREALLASSAFPGVFRPRWSWEVMPAAREQEMYVDGGVMDNLPLDAVVQFLLQASNARLLAARPEPVLSQSSNGGGAPVAVPHLLFSASLQPEIEDIDDERELEALTRDWPRLAKRTRTLSYNDKIDLFSRTQRAVRALYLKNRGKGLEGDPPLDIEVVVVKPRWLCGTFAFHPMLGFRREKQARSIAHGCASTLVTLARQRDSNENWCRGWGARLDALPQAPDEPGRTIVPLELTKSERRKGRCWFRPEAPCPFSAPELGRELPESTRRELARIHALCGDPRTHDPEAGRRGRARREIRRTVHLGAARGT